MWYLTYMQDTTQLPFTNTTSIYPAFGEWAKDNYIAENLKWMAQEMREGKVHGLKELATLLELAKLRGGKAFSGHVLSTLAEALETEIF
jgi:hypothetical protein